MDIPVGFEFESGTRVSIPVHHTIISAITRAGKSVAVEALVNRCQGRFLLMDVKDPRDYNMFASDVPLYLRDRVEPLMLKRLLESSSRLWLRHEFPELIEVCKSGTSYVQVLENIRKKLQEKIHPVVRKNLEVLEHLMGRLLDEMKNIKFVDSLSLPNRINVMNLSKIPRDIQQLVVDSTLREVLENTSDLIIVLDESHRFIPEGKPSASRDAVTMLIREGGAKNLFVYLVDQTITGIDKDAIKQCWVWLLGKQMELNESKRTLDQLPIKSGMTARNIMQLSVGQFLVCANNTVKKTYVQPTWLDDESARRVAVGELSVEAVSPPLPQPSVEIKRLQETIEFQKKRIQELETALKSSRVVSDAMSGRSVAEADLRQVVESLQKQVEELKAKQPVLPPQLDSLTEDEKTAWLFLKQKKAYRVDLKGYTGWGKIRLGRVVTSLDKKRLLGFEGKRIYAKEPMI